MMPRIVFILVCVPMLEAQADPKAIIQIVRDKIQATTTRMPRYLCTQTVDRQRFEPDKGFDVTGCPLDRDSPRKPIYLVESDRLRLDVTVAKNAEIFSWVGENHFAERSLWDFVSEGVLSNGTFYSFLSMIFLGDPTEFFYNGDVISSGRKLMEFGYLVPAEASHYRFGDRDSSKWWTTAYEGTVQVDPETGDLVRLVVRSTNLPKETGECQLETALTYTTIHLNQSAFLLPSETILKTLAVSGVEQANRTVYSNCHEFLGESTISFSDPPALSPARLMKATPAALRLPEGTAFSLELEQDIDMRSAAAGDPVKARLRKAIQTPGLFIPQGTLVNGRILKYREYYRPQATYVAIRFDSFQLSGGPQAFLADCKAPGNNPPVRSVRQQGQSLGTLSSMSEHNIAAYVYRNQKFPVVLRRGLQSNWITISP
jgi:hypothetical protein